MNVVEGETTDRVALRSGQQAHLLGFKVKLDKFNVSFYPSGAPQEFKSTLTILEGDRRVFTEPIRVNHPLTYQGDLFLSIHLWPGQCRKSSTDHSGPEYR
jgi:cytochrome c biogenesis protein